MSKSGLQIIAWVIVLGMVGMVATASWFAVTRGLRGLKEFFHLFKWLLIAIVAVFVFGLFQGVGVGGAGFSGAGSLNEQGMIARVAGRPVTPAAVSRMLENYKQYGIPEEQINQFAPSAIDSLINGEVEVIAAGRAGVVVSDGELRDRIINRYQMFGAKNADDYRKAVERMGYRDTAAFETALRDDLIREKYSRLIEDGQVVTDAEARASWLGENDNASGDYMLFDSASLKGAVPEPAEAEVQAAYAADIAGYQYGERRVVKVLAARAGDYQAGYTPTESDLSGWYNKHKADLAERCASHLMVRLDPGAEPGAADKVKALADEYAKRARAGEDFAALADKYTDDPGSKGKGGEYPCFTKAASSFVPEFTDAIYSAKKDGEIVGPIKTQFGWHVIKVSKIAPEPKPLTEPAMRELVITKFKADPATQANFKLKAAKAGEWMGKITDDASLEAAAKAQGLKVQSTAERPIEKQGFIPGIGSNPKHAEAIFAAKPGTVIPLKLDDGGQAVALVVSILPPEAKPLNEVRFQVVDGLKTRAAEALARQRADRLVAELRKPGSFKEAAQRAGFIRPERKPDDATPPPAEKPGSYFEPRTLAVNAGMKTINEFPDNRELLATLLGGEANQVVGPVAVKQGIAVFRLSARNRPVEADYPKNRAQVIAKLKRERAEPLHSSRIAAVRKELEAAGEIRKNDALIGERYPQPERGGMPPGYGQ